MDKLNQNSHLIDYYEGFHHKIKHLFLNKKKSDYLIVILCEKKIEDIAAASSVINRLDSLGNSILMIDDFINDMPSFYLGVNGKETIMKDISSLVLEKMYEEGKDVQRMIITGHGRGGTGALILSEKLKAQHLIVSFPSIYFDRSCETLGMFDKKELLNHIVSNPYNQSEQIIDELLHKKVLKDGIYHASINIQGNTADDSLNKIIKHFDYKKQKYILTNLQEYDNNELIFLNEYLPEKLNSIYNEMIIKEPQIEFIDKGKFLLELNLNNFDLEIMDVAIYFYSKKKREKAINYNKDLNYEVDIDLHSLDNIKIFVKKGKNVLDIKRYYI